MSPLPSDNPLPPEREPLHLWVLRGVVYSAAILVFAGPLATWPQLAAGISAALIGLAVCHWDLLARFRGLAVAAGVVGCVVLGLAVEPVLGPSETLARIVGPVGQLLLIESMRFALPVLGVAVALRTMGTRCKPLMVLELGLIVAVVVQMFIGHRDMTIAQPRVFADWALTHDYDPRIVLMLLGMATLGAIALLLLPVQRLTKTIAVVVGLVLFLVVGSLILETFREQREPPELKNRRRQSEMAQGRSHGVQGAEDPNKPYPGGGMGRSRPVAVVLLHEEFRPFEDKWYFREGAFSQINGLHVVRATDPRYTSDLPVEFPEQPVEVPLPEYDHRQTPDPFQQLLSGELHVTEEMPAEFKHVSTTVNLIEELDTPIGLVSTVEFEPRDNPDPTYFWTSYEVGSEAVYVPRTTEGPAGDAEFAQAMRQMMVDLAQRHAGNPHWTDEDRQHYLALPPAPGQTSGVDPRYKEFADKLLAEGLDVSKLDDAFKDSPYLKALVIRDWIRKNVTYSLDPKWDKFADPTGEFLFNHRHGRCEHIARAMVYLLRSQGVPARMGVGYMVGMDRLGSGTSITLMSGDRHGWPEIYLEGIGWIEVDVSPDNQEPGTVLPPPPDKESSRQLAQKARQKGKKQSRRTTDDLWAILWWTLGGIGGGTIGGLYAIKIYRRVAPRFAGTAKQYRLAYRAVLDRLADVGLHRRFGETREEFAQRVGDVVPELRDLTDAHLHRSLGGVDLGDRGRWTALREAVEQRIAAAFPRPRRVLGAVNPLTWLWVH